MTKERTKLVLLPRTSYIAELFVQIYNSQQRKDDWSDVGLNISCWPLVCGAFAHVTLCVFCFVAGVSVVEWTCELVRSEDISVTQSVQVIFTSGEIASHSLSCHTCTQVAAAGFCGPCWTLSKAFGTWVLPVVAKCVALSYSVPGAVSRVLFTNISPGRHVFVPTEDPRLTTRPRRLTSVNVFECIGLFKASWHLPARIVGRHQCFTSLCFTSPWRHGHKQRCGLFGEDLLQDSADLGLSLSSYLKRKVGAANKRRLSRIRRFLKTFFFQQEGFVRNGFCPAKVTQ